MDSRNTSLSDLASTPIALANALILLDSERMLAYIDSKSDFIFIICMLLFAQ